MAHRPRRGASFRRRAATLARRRGRPRVSPGVAALALSLAVLGAGAAAAYSAAAAALGRSKGEAAGASSPSRPATNLATRLRTMGPLPEGAVRPGGPSAGPPSATPTGHYYVGGYYAGPEASVDSVAVTIGVPDDTPVASEYYALLSIWDSAGSYDQLGIAVQAGGFGIGYSTSTYCAGTVESLAVGAQIAPGTPYTFEMSIASGVVNFSARDARTDAPVWSTTVTTGGDDFLAEANYTCDEKGYLGFSDYEEVYEAPGPLVPYDFWFTNDTAAGELTTNWSAFEGLTAPSGVEAVAHGANVTVENEPYYLAYLPGPEGPAKTLATEHNGSTLDVKCPVYVNALASSPEVNLTTYTVPPAWSVAFDPSTGTPPFVSELTATIPAGYGPGEFTLGLNATTASGDDDRSILNVTLASALFVEVEMSPSLGAVDIGHPLTFNTTVFGGIEPFSYDWGTVPPGCGAANSSILACTAEELGSCNVTLEVVDALNFTALAHHACTVDPELSVTLGSGTASPLQDRRFVLDATALGGTGVYRFTWEGLPPGCAGSDTGALACTPTQPGPFAVTVAVRDTGGGNASAAVGFTVVRTFLGAPFAAGYGVAAALGGTEVYLALVMVRRYRSVAAGASWSGTLAGVFGFPAGSPAGPALGPGGVPLCPGCGLDLPPGGAPCPRCGPPRRRRADR